MLRGFHLRRDYCIDPRSANTDHRDDVEAATDQGRYHHAGTSTDILSCICSLSLRRLLADLAIAISNIDSDHGLRSKALQRRLAPHDLPCLCSCSYRERLTSPYLQTFTYHRVPITPLYLPQCYTADSRCTPSSGNYEVPSAWTFRPVHRHPRIYSQRR